MRIVVVVVVGGRTTLRSTLLDVQYHVHIPPKIFFGGGGIHHSLTRFLFWGWDLSHLHLYYGFVRVKNMLSMPQVFEQSLFLFKI